MKTRLFHPENATVTHLVRDASPGCQMLIHLPRLLAPLLVAALFVFQGSAAETSLLAYDFSEARTNAYRITARTSTETADITVSGPIIVTAKPGQEGGTLIIRGQLLPKHEARPADLDGPMVPRGHGSRIHNPWFTPRQIISSPGTPEAQVDVFGRPLCHPGHLDLPYPVESFLNLLFPRLPQGGATEATFESEFFGRPSTGLPGAFYGGLNNGGQHFPGTRTERVKLADDAGDTIRLEREVQFRCFAKRGDQPRIAYSLKGVYVFEKEGAALKSGKLEGSATISSLDSAQNIPLQLQIERLQAAEWEKAIEGVPFLEPQVLSDETFAQCVAEITGNDPEIRRKAARKLMFTGIAIERAEKYRVAFLPLLEDPEHTVREVAVRILGISAKPEDVPLIIKKITRMDDFGSRFDLINALGRLKDERAIQPLADLIAYGSNEAQIAAHALSEFGPIVEDTALKLLQEKHAETRRLACEILSRVGTAKSIETLQQLLEKGNSGLLNQLPDTLDAIRTRIEGPREIPQVIPGPNVPHDPNLLL